MSDDSGTSTSHHRYTPESASVHPPVLTAPGDGGRLDLAGRSDPALPRDIDAYALDVDGTLVGRDGVPREVWPALQRSRTRGVAIGLCTGRLLAGATAALAERVDPNGVHVSQGGAVVSTSAGEVLWSSTLSDAQVSDLLALSRHPRVEVELYWHDGFGALEHSPTVMRHAHHLGVPVTRLSRHEPPPLVTSAVCLVREEDLPEIAPMIRAIPSVTLSPATTPWAPGLVFANVTAQGVSKGSALGVVADHLDTTVDRIAMVGDSENDLDALRAAGVAVVMGSAPDDLKALADVVVADVDEGGLAQALGLLDRYRNPM